MGLVFRFVVIDHVCLMRLPNCRVNRRAIAIMVFQVLLALAMMSFYTWNGVSWPGTIALGALIAVAITAANRRTNTAWAVAAESAASWICTIVAVSYLLDRNGYWKHFTAILATIVAWSTAASIFPALLIGNRSARRTNWKLQTVFWCILGALILVYNACWQNNVTLFYVGLVLTCLFVIGCKLWFRSPNFLILAQNTAIVFLVGLPIADLFVRPPIHMRINGKAESPTYYYWESATHAGRVYQCWWPLIFTEWERVQKIIAVRNHDGRPQYRFKPGAKASLYQSDIRINNLGFRGNDVSPAKGNTFRIVAIGESTTFGITLYPDDRPWPDLLQEMIRTRLSLTRPVEVINAGFPGSTIEDSLSRLEQEVLRLKPDMIISYHGINGFNLLDEALPLVTDPQPPRYADRPLQLIANLEYVWKIQQFNKRRATSLERHPPTFHDVLSSRYATSTRRLVDICKTNHIDLVVGTFSLAVNSGSEQEVVDFYHRTYPELRWTIRANEAYTTMLTAMARDEPTIHLVDTRPGLDGDFTKFTDLMHLTQTGRQKVADAFFAASEPILKAAVQNTPEH